MVFLFGEVRSVCEFNFIFGVGVGVNVKYCEDEWRCNFELERILVESLFLGLLLFEFIVGWVIW